MSLEIGTLFEGSDHHTLTANGELGAFSHGGDLDQVEIVVWDLGQEVITKTILLEGYAPLDVSISPDGALLAYILTPLPDPENDGAGEIPAGSGVFLTAIVGDQEPLQVGVCSFGCTGLFWSPDSLRIGWGDIGGLWVSAPAFSEVEGARQVLEPFITGVSGQTEIVDSYLPIEWSPSGRYLLVRKGLESGVVRAVVDTNTGLLENLPGTGEEIGPLTGFAWLTGDRLLLAREGLDEGLPEGQIWELSTLGTGSLFTASEIIFLAEKPELFPMAPSQRGDGLISLALINLNNQSLALENGIYLLNLLSDGVQRVNALPFMQVQGMLWVPDGRGVLVWSDTRTLYLPSDGGQIYSFGVLFGKNTCCYQWIDPR